MAGTSLRYLLLPFLLALLLPIGLGGCAPVSGAHSASQDWVRTDLRSLDAADASRPGYDLLAAYVRQVDSIIQFRLDFLDLEIPEADVYLALDSAPGGTNRLPIDVGSEILWDTLLVIPAEGTLQVLDEWLEPAGGSSLTVLRDPQMDSLEISLRRSSLPGGGMAGLSHSSSARLPRLRVEVFVTPAGESRIVDRLTVFAYDDPPPDPAAVLLAFWDTLPAYTPALALRRWDGAHTGPLGGRHGLYNLLRTARNSRTPLALLDLTTPTALAGLEYLGQVEMVQDLQRRGLLLLADSVPGYPPGNRGAQLSPLDRETAGRLYRETSRQFGFPQSAFLFAPNQIPGGPVDHRVIFASDPEVAPLTPVQKQRWRQSGLIPLPAEPMPEQLSTGGLGEAVIRALIDTALSPKPDLLFLGGSLPDTAWGSPQSARAAFHYIDQHPWIEVLDGAALLGLQARPGAPGANRVASGAPPPVPGNFSLPEMDFPAYTSAIVALTGPIHPAPEEISTLRGIYLQQARSLGAAARWAAEPEPAASCGLDPDEDGQPECILASESVWALFDAQAGGLEFLFVRSGGSVHQLIGPSWQLAAGLSEPTTWNLDGPLPADPSILAGALFEHSGNPSQADSQPVYSYTQPSIGRLTFTQVETNLQKSFTLLEDGLQVEVVSGERVQTSIPLVLDPWLRFQPGWAESYASAPLPDGLTWKIAGGPQVSVRSTADMALQDFRASRRFIDLPEDPNRDVSPGHYLPFPLGLIQLEADGSFALEIRLDPEG